jgi:hypothetical protein
VVADGEPTPADVELSAGNGLPVGLSTGEADGPTTNVLEAAGWAVNCLSAEGDGSAAGVINGEDDGVAARDGAIAKLRVDVDLIFEVTIKYTASATRQVAKTTPTNFAPKNDF